MLNQPKIDIWKLAPNSYTRVELGVGEWIPDPINTGRRIWGPGLVEVNRYFSHIAVYILKGCHILAA